MLSFASNEANLAAQEQHYNKHLHKCGSWLSAHRPIVFTRIYAGIIPYSQIMPKIMPQIVGNPYLEPGNSMYEPKNLISPTMLSHPVQCTLEEVHPLSLNALWGVGLYNYCYSSSVTSSVKSATIKKYYNKSTRRCYTNIHKRQHFNNSFLISVVDPKSEHNNIDISQYT